MRGRRWLDREKSVDVTAGALLWGTDGEEYNYPGFVGTASMNFNDWENLHLTVTALPVRFNSLSPQETEFGAFLGYGIAGKPGFVTTVVAWLALGLLVVAFVASGGYE